MAAASARQNPARAGSPSLSAQAVWKVFALLSALPWLLPIHQRPWTSFHAEALMGIVMLGWVGYTLVVLRREWSLPDIAVALAVAAVVPLAQHAAERLYFLEDALIASAYLLAMALCVATGRRMEQQGPGGAQHCVMASFALASLLSLLFACIQWLQLDGWSDLVMQSPGRVVANVAHSNKLALLFLWGIVATWWFHREGRLGGGLATIVAALLIFGVVMTQSRMGSGGLLILASIALLRAHLLQSRQSVRSLIVLAIWTVTCYLVWAPLNQMLGLQSSLEPVARAVGTRPIHWATAFDAMGARPLEGWGWLQISVAQGAHAPDFPATGEVLSSAHNLLLDLILWNGLPLGLLAGVGLLAWFAASWRHARDHRQVLVMTALTLLLWHSMVEMPHMSTVILLPAGMLAGTVVLPVRRRLVVRPVVLWVLIAGLAVWLGMLIRDYFMLEEALLAERSRRANIGSAELRPLPDLPTLNHAATAMLAVPRVSLHAAWTPREQLRLEQAVGRFPSPYGLLLVARGQALGGRPAEAARTLLYLCRTHTRRQCVWAKDRWSEMAAETQALAGVPSPLD